MKFWQSAVASVAVTALSCVGALAQTVKLGVVSTYSGPFAAVGEQLDRGIQLYMKLHEKDLPPGVKLEIIRRDDTGPNPEVAKRMAQELITRDHVQLLAGAIYTPNALAIAPLATEAKVPFDRHECRHRDDHHQVAVHRARVVHHVAVELSAGCMGGEERHQEGVYGGRRLWPGNRREAAFTKGFTAAVGRLSDRCTCRWPIPTLCRSCSGPRMPRRTLYSPLSPPASSDGADEDVRRSRIERRPGSMIGPGDITTDEELHEHGRRGARRGDDATIRRLRDAARQPGFRQGLEGGVRSQ